jgi:hypothetical protein
MELKSELNLKSFILGFIILLGLHFFVQHRFQVWFWRRDYLLRVKRIHVTATTLIKKTTNTEPIPTTQPKTQHEHN